MSDLIYTDEEMDQAEKSAEAILCIKCNISKDEKDCSSCEEYMSLRDSHLPSPNINIENRIVNHNCINVMRYMDDNSVDFTLTDIPYDAVNRTGNGLRNLDKGKADIITFDLISFTEEVLRVTKNSICIFCSKEQFSTIYEFFANQKGTVRPIVWRKTNPSPMNGQYIYISGVEMGVWFKKSGAKTFNAHCKNSVFDYPNGRSKLHPTEKNHGLLKELILDNTNENDIVFDPCCGSGSHCLVAKENNRRYFGIELDKGYYDIANNRLCLEVTTNQMIV